MPSRREIVLAQNEVLFRELNAAIRGEGGQASHDFVCECSDVGCQEIVTLTLGQYRAVRADARCFFVRPEHDTADVEDVVERHDAYWVVRKHPSVGDVVER